MANPQSSSPEPRVQSSLEEIYIEFKAPVPRVIEGCPCCLWKRGVDVLLKTPLRELTGGALWSYTAGVFDTVGSQRDYRYFLPRMLDLAVNYPNESIDREIVLSTLSRADWHSWPARERKAIEDLVDGWFELELARDLADAVDNGAAGEESGRAEVGWEAESVLCGAARAGLPLGRWLARLQEADAAPVLADLTRRFPKHLSGWWESAPTALEELSAILAP